MAKNFRAAPQKRPLELRCPKGKHKISVEGRTPRGIHEFVCEIVGVGLPVSLEHRSYEEVAQLPRICIREGADDIEPGSGLPVASPCEPASRRRALNVACRARSSGLPSHCSRYRGVDPAAALSRGGGRCQHAPGPRPSSSVRAPRQHPTRECREPTPRRPASRGRPR